MRVRYKTVRDIDGWSCECDLSEKKARKIFDEMKTIPTILWAELVGEDDDNYMDVIDSFEHDYDMALFIKEMGGTSKYEI